MEEEILFENLYHQYINNEITIEELSSTILNNSKLEKYTFSAEALLKYKNDCFLKMDYCKKNDYHNYEIIVGNFKFSIFCPIISGEFINLYDIFCDDMCDILCDYNFPFCENEIFFIMKLNKFIHLFKDINLSQLKNIKEPDLNDFLKLYYHCFKKRWIHNNLLADFGHYLIGQKNTTKSKIYLKEQRYMLSNILDFIFGYSQVANDLFEIEEVDQFIIDNFDICKDYLLKFYNKKTATNKFVKKYYSNLSDEYILKLVELNPYIIPGNEFIFEKFQTEREGEPFVKLPDTDFKCYLEYKPYDMFDSTSAFSKINSLLEKKEESNLPQNKAILILLSYNSLVLKCLKLYQGKINYETQDLYDIFNNVVFRKYNFITICRNLNLDSSDIENLIQIYQKLGKTITKEYSSYLSQNFTYSVNRSIKESLDEYQVVQKLKKLYYSNYEKKCKDESKKNTVSFLQILLTNDKNFINLLNNNRLNNIDIEDILIISKIFDDNLRNHLEEIVKQSRISSLNNYNKIVKASFLNDDELEKVLESLNLNQDNIYDYILNNKVLHKKEKQGLIRIARIHYKDYISVLDIMYLLDEMVEKSMTIDQILKEKEINKKDFYDLYQKSLDQNPILYEYIYGKLNINKKRGFKRLIKLGLYIINHVNSYEQCQREVNYDIEEILNSLKNTSIYDDLLYKINKWSDWDTKKHILVKK